MPEHIITNFDALNTSPLRHDALTVAEAGYRAIDTAHVLRSALSFDGTYLRVLGRVFDLSAFKRVSVIGFGKTSCAATAEIERILKGRMHAGIVFDVHAGICEIADVFEGSHPHPSTHNVEITKRIVDMSVAASEEDLVIVIVSGGGSALLCFPMEECDQGTRLYEDFKESGATIEEMNTVRKHISSVKGGGLAKMLYPATVVGLIFCDIPGEMYEQVASGPTYYDRSTIDDAQAVLDRYHLHGYTLSETPKETHFFERVYNIPVVSNIHALQAMEHAARGLGYHVIHAGSAQYLEASGLATHLLTLRGHKTAVIAGGEPRLKVSKAGGKGGRCQYTALCGLERLIDGDVFLAFASDGIDNSDAAGAIIDASVAGRATHKGFSIPQALESFDTYSILEATGDLLKTGALESNVSDLFVLLTR